MSDKQQSFAQVTGASVSEGLHGRVGRYKVRNKTSRLVALNGALLAKLIGHFSWFAYLMILVCAAFVQTLYNSIYWLQLSGALYAFGGCYMVYVASGGRANWAALQAATWPLVILLCLLFWLGLQLVLPVENNIYAELFNIDAAPAWFNPDVNWSVVPAQTQTLLMSGLMCFSVFVLSLLLIDSRQRVKQVLIVIMLVGLVHALSGIFAKYADIILVERRQVDGHFSAARGWFINRNHYAAFLVLATVGPLSFMIRTAIRNRQLSVVSLLKAQLFSKQLFFIVAFLIFFVALALSQSRAGFLSLPAAVAALFALFRKDLERLGTSRRVVISMVFILFLMLAYFGQDLLARLSGNFLSLGERGIQWALTWQAIKQQWLLGYGGGSYPVIFQLVREYADLRQVIYDQSHNYYLQLWLEQGLVGLLLWQACLILVFRSALYAFRGTSSSLVGGVILSCVVVLVAALLQSVVDFNLQILNIRYYFFVIMALIFCAPNMRQVKTKKLKRRG